MDSLDSYYIDIGLWPVKDELGEQKWQAHSGPSTLASWEQIQETANRLLKLYYDNGAEIAIRLRRYNKPAGKPSSMPVHLRSVDVTETENA